MVSFLLDSRVEGWEPTGGPQKRTFRGMMKYDGDALIALLHRFGCLLKTTSPIAC